MALVENVIEVFPQLCVVLSVAMFYSWVYPLPMNYTCECSVVIVNTVCVVGVRAECVASR